MSVAADRGDHQWERHGFNDSTDHSIPLYGFRADSSYELTLTIRDGAGNSVVYTGITVDTAPLPADFAQPEILVHSPALMEPGFTLFGFRNPDRVGYTTILDSDGEVVWYIDGHRGDIRQERNGNLFAIGDNDLLEEINLLGEQVTTWHASASGTTPPSGAIAVDTFSFHHEAFPTSHGTILVLSRAFRDVDDFPTSDSDPSAPTATVEVVDDPIIEFERATGAVVGEWALLDLLDPHRIGYDVIRSDENDWAHANAVIHDPRDDSVIVSVRHQDCVVKFDRSTGQLKWILGNHENWAPEFQPFFLTPVGGPFEWQYHQHAPTILPNGNLLLYDNGNHRAMPFDPPLAADQSYSRAVEYEIDESAMEVRQIWEHGTNTPEILFSRAVSDADYMPITGNRLIVHGRVNHVNGVPTPSNEVRIMEVTHDYDNVNPSQTVFEVALRGNTVGGPGWFTYRAERIPDLYGCAGFHDNKDTDGDRVVDPCDNCPLAINDLQEDFDEDGHGDACESGALLVDANVSGRVDGFDLVQLARAFGSRVGDAAYDESVDFTRDGVVDGLDLAMMAPLFGADVL